jgi:predicted dehydrogenase
MREAPDVAYTAAAAVHIATPDPWHAIATILVCRAGKDVYVEKPASLTIREGRAMVNAARKHDRIVQVGTQHRSAPRFMKIAEIIQRGNIGSVRSVRVWNYANHTPNGMGNFRYFWDYSGGYITDFGNHRLISMQQIMGVPAPRTICASGGRLVLQDDREAPDFFDGDLRIRRIHRHLRGLEPAEPRPPSSPSASVGRFFQSRICRWAAGATVRPRRRRVNARRA